MLEEAGLVTVQLSSNRSQSETILPPRALFCRFPLGRPLGEPNDAVYQRKVLDAAFELLTRDAGPVLEEFPEEIASAADEPLSCPLPPGHDPSLPKEVDEALALRPAYDRQLAASGRSVVGKVVGPDGVAEVVERFVRVDRGEDDWTALQQMGDPTLLAQDVRGYYEEAALALADHVSGANQTSAWFYRTTATGALFLRVLAIMREADAPRPLWSLLAPRVYQD